MIFGSWPAGALFFDRALVFSWQAGPSVIALLAIVAGWIECVEHWRVHIIDYMGEQDYGW